MLLVWFVERSQDGEHHEVDGGEEEGSRRDKAKHVTTSFA